MAVRPTASGKSGKTRVKDRGFAIDRPKPPRVESSKERNSVARPSIREYLCPGLREEQEQSMSGTFFYGLEAHLPKAVEFAQQVKSRVPRATWTDKDKLHVTLLFKGKTCPTDTESFLRLCAETPPFRLKVKGFGTFNNRSGPRVLFGRCEPIDVLKDLHARLGGHAETFTPHLTIAKLEDIGDAEPDFANIVQQYHTFDFGDCLVDELKLYQTQGEGRPYRVAAWHRLCGTSQER